MPSPPRAIDKHAENKKGFPGKDSEKDRKEKIRSYPAKTPSRMTHQRQDLIQAHVIQQTKQEQDPPPQR